MRRIGLRCLLAAMCCFCYAPMVLAEGGETCADALVIPNLPYCDTGRTSDNANDYTPPCVTSAAAPDVVYRYTPPATQIVTVSLCFSNYNTALHVWRGCPTAGGVLICCNDNLCGLRSCCNGVTLLTGQTYYFIVDGSLTGGGASSGEYTIHVVTGDQCPTQNCVQDTCPYPSADIEPNNSCTAQMGSIQCGDTVCGVIEQGNVDYILLRVAGPTCQNVIIDVFGDDTPGFWPFGQGLNPRVNLYNADCSVQVATDVNSGVGEDARLDSLCLEPGLYKILIAGEPQASNFGPYIVATSCTPCVCPLDTCTYPVADVEPLNNVCLNQVPIISCGDTLCGDVEAGTSGDYYRFRVSGPGCKLVKVDVLGDDTPGWYPFGRGLDPVVAVYADNCADLLMVDDNSGTGNDAHLEVCLREGQYRLFISAAAQTAIGPYVLATYCEPCECPDTCNYPNRDNEQINNTCQTFNPQLGCPDTVCGEITPLGDHDWYLVQAQGAPCVRITIDVFGDDTPGWWPFGQGLNPLVRLVSVDCGTVYATDLNSGAGEDPRLISPCLPAGLYHIVVEGEGAAAPSTGPYILAVSCQGCLCEEPCSFVCPPGGIPENEPCPNIPDLYNSGCDNPLVHPVLPVQCGQIYCGTLFADSLRHDNDWYYLTTNLPDTIWWCVVAEQPVAIYMFAAGPAADPCLGLDTVDCARVFACDTVCIGACVPPGRYAFKIQPLFSTPTQCFRYVAWLNCTICTPQGIEAPDSVVIHFPVPAIPNMQLYWPPVPGASDYYVYRDSISTFVPGFASFVGATPDTFFVDPGIIANSVLRNFYKVVAHRRANGCR